MVRCELPALQVKHWNAFDFDGYEDQPLNQQFWVDAEQIVLRWLLEYPGYGQFHFDENYGVFRFEREEDLVMFNLKFGNDIRNIK